MSSKKNKSRVKGKSARRLPQGEIASIALLGALAATSSDAPARQDAGANARGARTTPEPAADPNLALLQADPALDQNFAQADDLSAAEGAIPAVENELIAALSESGTLSDAGSQLHGLSEEALARELGLVDDFVVSDTVAEAESAESTQDGQVRQSDADAGDGTKANAAGDDVNVQVAQANAASGTKSDASPAEAGSAKAGGAEGAPADPNADPNAPNAEFDPNAMPATGAGPLTPALAGLGGAGAAGGAAAAAAAVASSTSNKDETTDTTAAAPATPTPVTPTTPTTPTTPPATGGTTTAATVTKSLRIVDPPVKGAKVVYDANKNGKQDADEAVGTTDDKGYINISYTSVAGGQFLVFGGQDSVTGKKFGADDLSGVLLDDGSGTPGIVSPLSTLLATSGGAVSEADLKTLLGLPADTNLTTYDYYGAMETGGAGAAVATKALQLATLIETVSKSASSYLSTDTTVDFSEKKSVSDAIGSALKLAAAQTTAGTPMSTASLSKLVTQVAVTTSAVIKSGTTDVTATLNDFKTAFAAGTLDATIATKLAAMPGVNAAEVQNFTTGVSNLAAATSDAYQNFVPNATGATAAAIDAKLDALAALSSAMDSVAEDLSGDGSTSAGSDTLLAYLQSTATLNSLAESTQFQALAASLANSTTSTADSISAAVAQQVSLGSSVTGINAPPVANTDAATLATSWMTPVQGNVLSNDTDVDAGVFAAKVASVNGNAASMGHQITGTYGILQLNDDGRYIYTFDTASPTLPLGTDIVDSFSYTSVDTSGASSDGATLDITIPTYGAGHTVAAGTHLDTSYTGLKALGLNVVNPLDAGALFVSLDTAGGGAALSSATVQSIIAGGTGMELPAFADQLNVTLNVTQAQVASLVDMLDGTVNGKYDGDNAGFSADNLGIDHIGLDTTQGGASLSGATALNLSAQEMLAIKDAGLDFAPGALVHGDISEAAFSGFEIEQLANWAAASGVDHLGVALSDAQASSMELDGQHLQASAVVDLTVAGTHLSTSLKGLAGVGVDSVAMIGGSLSVDLTSTGDALSAADAQSIYGAGSTHQLPNFAPGDNVSLDVTQAQVANLVDLLDGTANGRYDGAHSGIDLAAYGIDQIGLDGVAGASALSVSAQEMLAIKDAGLDFARGDSILGSINDATLSAAQTSNLATWAVAGGVDQLNVELTDAQAAAMGAAAMDLPDAAAVHLTAEGSHLATSLKDLADLGVDSVDTNNVQDIIDVKLGINVPDSATVNSALEALLTHFKPDGVTVTDIFQPADKVNLELGAAVNINDVSAQVLIELKLLGVDTITGADLDGNGIPDQPKGTG